MDRHFTVYRRLNVGEMPPEEVFTTVEQALRRSVGGAIRRVDNTFHIDGGTNNLSFAFAGDLTATIQLTQASPGVIDIEGTVTLSPNTVFWVCAVGGLFCLWFLWIANVMYFVINPQANYQQALDSIQLPQASGGSASSSQSPYGS